MHFIAISFLLFSSFVGAKEYYTDQERDKLGRAQSEKVRKAMGLEPGTYLFKGKDGAGKPCVAWAKLEENNFILSRAECGYTSVNGGPREFRCETVGSLQFIAAYESRGDDGRKISARSNVNWKNLFPNHVSIESLNQTRIGLIRKEYLTDDRRDIRVERKEPGKFKMTFHSSWQKKEERENTCDLDLVPGFKNERCVDIGGLCFRIDASLHQELETYDATKPYRDASESAPAPEAKPSAE